MALPGALGLVVGLQIAFLGWRAYAGAFTTPPLPGESGMRPQTRVATGPVDRRPVPPPAGAPASAPMPVASLPCNEVLAGAVRLGETPVLALSAAQKARLAPLAQALRELLESPRARAASVLATATRVLRPDQLACVAAHRGAPLPADPAVGDVTDPNWVGAAVSRLLRRRAAETAVAPPAEASGGPTTPLASEDVLGGILKLEADPRERVTPAQARALLAPLDALTGAERAVDERKRALLEVLTPAQKDRVMLVHQEAMRQGTPVAAAEQLIAELQRQLR